MPQLEFRSITTAPFDVLGTQITPVRLKHGPRFDVLGFRIGDVAYCTDCNAIPQETMDSLRGLDLLVLDALGKGRHPTHFSLDEAVAVARELAPKRTLFTHISHGLDHEETNAGLPAGMALAHDGLVVDL